MGLHLLLRRWRITKLWQHVAAWFAAGLVLRALLIFAAWITTGGVVSIYNDTRIRSPYAITPGPDGALWFTNEAGNSIGRISTAGAITFFGGPGISAPQAITAGPDTTKVPSTALPPTRIRSLLAAAWVW